MIHHLATIRRRLARMGLPINPANRPWFEPESFTVFEGKLPPLIHQEWCGPPGIGVYACVGRMSYVATHPAGVWLAALDAMPPRLTPAGFWDALQHFAVSYRPRVRGSSV